MRVSGQPRTAKRTRDPDSKRAALHHAALHLFTEKGYENVSIAQIAKAAGIAVGTVYRFYDNKLSMLRAMLQEIEEAFVSRMKEDWLRGGSEAERLGLICEGVFDVAEEQSSLLRLLTMTTDVVYENGMLPGDIIQEQIGKLYREGMAGGGFLKGDPDMMAAMAHGLVEGAMMRFIRSDSLSRDEAVQSLSTVMKNAFVATQ